MKTTPVTPADLRRSVLAVPPLAWRDDLSLNAEANLALVDHILKGGVTTLVYGGNANAYHLGGWRWREVVEFIAQLGDETIWVVPPAGPSYDVLLEQAPVLRELGFPTAMLLPMAFPSHPAGVERGIRDFVDRFGREVMLYLRGEPYLSPQAIGRLAREGAVGAIKYAASRERPRGGEPYLAALIEEIGRERIVSGFGEVPAVPHLRDYRLAAFTSGLVCIAPTLSMALLDALQNRRLAEAEARLVPFLPLERLRDVHSPIRVMHEAVRLAGIADTGPILPLLANLEEEHHAALGEAAMALLALEARTRIAAAPAAAR
jgi:dihydrodipicolinate synthase/N-acetylneuraminate lyase